MYSFKYVKLYKKFNTQEFLDIRLVNDIIHSSLELYLEDMDKRIDESIKLEINEMAGYIYRKKSHIEKTIGFESRLYLSRKGFVLKFFQEKFTTDKAQNLYFERLKRKGGELIKQHNIDLLVCEKFIIGFENNVHSYIIGNREFIDSPSEIKNTNEILCIPNNFLKRILWKCHLRSTDTEILS